MFNGDSAAVVAAEAAIAADDAMAGDFGIEVFAHNHADGARGIWLAGEDGDLFVSHGLAGGDFFDDFVNFGGEGGHCFVFNSGVSLVYGKAIVKD